MRRLIHSTVLLLLCSCQAYITVVPSPTISLNLEESPMTTAPTTSTPTFAPSPTPTETTIPVDVPTITITTLFDNYSFDSRLKTSWGFSALVQRGEHTVLFDTGASGAILLENMSILGIEPTAIESIVLSHIHGDHVDGLQALLNTGIQPTVCVPPSFPSYFKDSVRQSTELVDVEPGLLIAEDIYTTGEIGSQIPEQALVIRTTKGLVVITGCAHPGVVQMVERAQELFGDPIYLVMGGFHLLNKPASAINSIIEDFRRLEVQKVAPSHCTGDQAIALFREAYQDDFIEAGVGKVLVINP
jgi:7,8-dihydropterin-6-yl-methyl-4-(beta-D-ribofuranosyl)aminobenzene 5'-phosphate synthase